MGFFSAFRTPKAYTGVVVKKAPHTSTDSDGDRETSYDVTIKIDSEDGVARERTVNVTPEIYNKVEIGNEVIKSANRYPVIQLGTHRKTS